MRTLDPRLRVPAVMALGGSAIALATLVGSGWAAALAVAAVTVGATVGYYVLGGHDSDLGAWFGSRPDERQSTLEVRAAAFAGIMMCAVALAGFVVATALGSATWPFALFAVVGSASFLTGSVVYRSRE